MARRYIIIAKADGTGKVDLTAAALKLPDPYPELQFTDDDKTFQMRPGPSGLGNRIHKALGSDINHAEISFNMHSLSSADVTNLRAMYTSKPNVVLFSLDSGTTRYYAKFKNNGLLIEGYQNNEDPVTAGPYFLKGSCELYILQTTTQNFV